jgi:hypothetical protein
MQRRGDSLELVVATRAVITRAELTYAISSIGPRMVKMETTRDTSHIKQFMPWLNVDDVEEVAD